MRKFFSFIIRQSVAIVLAVIFILAFGVYATVQMPINLLPDINVPMVCVQVIYPGANAQSVEKDVTSNLEEGLSAIGGVTAVDSYSYDNLSAVVLSFDYGTDTSAKQNEINGKISAIDLPEGVTVDVYDIDLNAEALAVLSVTATQNGGDEGANLASSYAAAEELAARISAIDGVENVAIKGGPQKIWSVRPFKGLELTVPLVVQAFSYGALDLPLGNLTDAHGEVQIRNNSNITCAEDIRSMPISLPSAIVSLLTSVRTILGYYQDLNAEELEELQLDLAEGVAAVLADLDDMTAEEIDELAKLKTYMVIASTVTAQNLKDVKSSRYYSEIYERVEGLDDEEIQELAEQINDLYPLLNVSADLLKIIRDGKIDCLIAFREQIEDTTLNPDYDEGSYYALTDGDYLKLAKEVVYAEGTPPEDEILLERINFVKQTSAAGLSAIAARKRDNPDYVPTDGECALLFTGTPLSFKHPVIMSPTFISFVRSKNYEYNMGVLVEKRKEFGEEITAEQYYELYTLLKLEGVTEVTLSKELIAFIIEPSRDFSNLVTDSNGNSVFVVRVDEIANVSEEEQFSSYVYFGNGATPTIIKGTTIEIYKSNGANSSAVVKRVKQIYAEYLGTNGENIHIELLDDQSQFIAESISNVLVSMIIGGLLAVLVIFLFLKRVKTSLIIAITMPLSVLAAMVCLYLLGITLNMVSLGGLAVGIGMLVDNSIVVIESISKHRDMDKSAFQAAVDGTTEVGGALFGSTVTTVCVFIPIIFAGGLTGEIFTDLSYAVIFSLTLSLIVAVTVIPALYALLCGDKRMLKGGALSKDLPEKRNTGEEFAAESCDTAEEHAYKKSSVKQRIAALKEPKIMNGITNFYGAILPKILKRKAIPILCAVVMFGASIGLLFLTGTEFLPSIDKGQIEIDMAYESGTPLVEIQRDVAVFAQKIETEFKDNLQYVSVSVGKNGLLALTDTGIITIQLKSNRGTENRVNRIREMAENDEGALAGRKVSVRQIDGVVASLMSGADDLSVTILGDDTDGLVRIAGEIMAGLEAKGFKDVKSSATDKAVQYTMKFDRTALAQKGLDYRTTVLTLRIGIASYTACTAVIDGEECEVSVSFDANSIVTVTDLENLIIGYETVDGSPVAIKLKDVVMLDSNGHIPREEVEACIRRSNGKKMVSVSAVMPGLDTGSAGDMMLAVANEVLARPENSGYGYQQSGISSYLKDAFEGLAIALVVSLFLLYAVMAIQFGSALKPLIIMASIPFSFTGGFIALVITGTSLNVVSFIGLIMLTGVVVNNAIVMLEKIKQLHEEGMPHFEAVVEACKVRLRPIFMTTLTTILALIPLAIGLGQGAELMQPLGIVVIGGLLIGTLVTLVLIPAVYCAVHRLKKV